jgi:exodeoxyribonuclease VII large subunit
MSTLLDSLFDEEETRPLTISELNDSVKRELERRFASVWIEGEILDFFDAHSGHWYFTLHDGDSQIKAACYKGTNWKIRFKPFDGIQVRVRGKLSLYAPRGEYQILVESLEPVGEGALKVAFEQIKLKLGKDRFAARLPCFKIQECRDYGSDRSKKEN